MMTIIECVAASVTAIVLGSLWLADRICKAERERDEAEDIEVVPYAAVAVGVPCPKCGVKAVNPPPFGVGYGPRVPTACTSPKRCPCKRPHLHMSCWSCRSQWFMSTRDATVRRAMGAEQDEKNRRAAG